MSLSDNRKKIKEQQKLIEKRRKEKKYSFLKNFFKSDKKVEQKISSEEKLSKELDENIQEELEEREIEKISYYECPRCEEHHKTKQEAINCCNSDEYNIKKILIYECPECEYYYETRGEARECCDCEKIKTNIGYKCLECDEHHKTKQEAMTCCGFDIDDIKLIEEFKCPKCEELYDKEEFAYYCCKEEESKTDEEQRSSYGVGTLLFLMTIVFVIWQSLPSSEEILTNAENSPAEVVQLSHLTADIMGVFPLVVVGGFLFILVAAFLNNKR